MLQFLGKYQPEQVKKEQLIQKINCSGLDTY